jgi:site-specific DNA-methyltransferase (adenine-specific)
MEINKNYNENCLDTMSKMNDDFLDLTVTSPPYDNLRTYNGYSFDFESIAKELYRVTKEGGVVVWVIGDGTKNGSESGSSFRQALYFMECGFKLHDTMIWNKPDAKPLTHKRYEQSFEYMFVFCKGKISIFNGIKDKSNKWAGAKEHGTYRHVDGTTIRKSGHNKKIISDFGLRHNTWSINTVKTRKYNHPAKFPEQLANDHILSWSNEGDLVYDCFMGSGTTAKMSILNKRNWIGSEMSSEYCEIIRERIAEQPQTSLGF